MASFTDQISNFNPYVQQLPVDAMVQVGMQKQAQYDAGVQKIQGYLDNIAGMDVLRPQDKELLQSKLNDLGNRLKTVAAGDFSNAQLVNSVGGMATQIVKDEDVMNAVSSTAAYKKAIEERKAYLKEGKTSPSNDLDFKKRYESWLNGDIKASFSGGYEPYTNWKKEAVETIKALTGDSTITENAFTTQVDPKTGKSRLVLADAISVEKYKGLSPEKINKALQSTLSPAAFRQMELDGLYQYHGKTAEDLKDMVIDSIDDRKKPFIAQKEALESALTGTSDATQKEDLRAKINNLNKYLGSLDSEQAKLFKAVEAGDLDSVRANMYTLNALTDMSSSFSYKEIENTWKDSPLADMAMRREIKNLEHQDRVAALNASNYWKSVEHQDRVDKLNFDKASAAGAFGGLLSDIPQNELPKITTAKVIEDTKIAASSLQSQDKEFMKTHGKDLTWFSQQRAAWEARPNGVDPDVAAYFNNTEGLRRDVEANTQMIAQISDAADAKFGKLEKYVPANAPVVHYKSPSMDFTYTAQDFTNFLSSNNAFVKTTAPAGPGGKPSVQYDVEGARKNMSPKQFHLWELYNGIKKGQGAEKKLVETAKWYSNNVMFPYNETLTKKNEYMADEVKNRVTVGQGVEYGFPIAKPEDKQSATNFLLSAAKLGESQTGRLPGSDGTVSTLKEIAGNLKGLTIKVAGGTRYQPTSYRVTALGEKGQSISFTLSPEQKAASMGGLFDKSPAAAAAAPYMEQLARTGGRTTAIDGSNTNNEYNSFLGSIDFPNVKYYGMKANIVPRGGGFGYRFTIFDPVKKTWIRDIPYPAADAPPMSEEDITRQRLGFTDSSVHELLTNSPATAKTLQIIKNASKIPL